MLARSAGAQVHTGSSVIGMCRHGDQHILQTPQGRVRANHVVIATNGYSTEHLHPLIKSRLMPVLSSIVVTQPLSPEQQRQARSEEHTSELQSRGQLVCRLLLEKKK